MFFTTLFLLLLSNQIILVLDFYANACFLTINTAT